MRGIKQILDFLKDDRALLELYQVRGDQCAYLMCELPKNYPARIFVKHIHSK